jgi:RNA polymerase sigma factor (sigma-70 family)
MPCSVILYPDHSGGVQEGFVVYGQLRKQLAELLRLADGRRLTCNEARAVLEMAERVEQQRHKLIVDNWPLAKKWCKRYPVRRNGGYDYGDTFDIATERLMKSVEMFAPSEGTRFSSYAARAIRGALYLENKHAIRDPSNTDLQPNARTLSSRAPRPPDIAIVADMRRHVASALWQLSRRERVIVIRRILRGELLTDIGKRYGLSKERIRQIVEETKPRLRELLGKDSMGICHVG